MADTKIHDLTLGTMAATDEFPTAISPFTSGANRKYAISDLDTFLSATTKTLTNKTIDLGSNTVTMTSLQLKTALSDETGSGSAVFATTPTLVTPVLGVATGTGITLTEAVGSSALILTGATQTTSFPVLNATQTWNAGGVTFTGIKLNVTNTASAAASLLIDLQYNSSSVFSVRGGSGQVNMGSASAINFGGNGFFGGANTNGFVFLQNSGGSVTTYFGVIGTSGTFQHGSVDVDTNAAIVAQITRSQGTLAGGTSDQAGKDWTFIASPGKGTGAGGSFIFQTTPAGGSGTTVGTATTALTIDSTKLCTFANSVIRINQTPSSIGTGVKTVSSSADSTTNFGHYISINMNGTTYYIPCGATAPT